jgi:hypothetical protein
MSVVTAVAIVGVVAAGVSAAMSFAQANKQKKLQKEAEAEADKAMESARKRLNVNYMDALSVQKEPYELQREAMLAQGMQATDAAQESERGAAAGAGRVQMAQNEAQGDIRTAMGKELTEIERLRIAEQARLRDLNVQLDLGEVEGAQMAARNAQEMAAQQTTQGWEGVTSAATQAANIVPLYGKTGITQDSLKSVGKIDDFGKVNGLDVDFSNIAGYDQEAWRTFKGGLNTDQKRLIRANQGYTDYWDRY